jgi:tRNA threonylcarbamoyl adenosine modification protein (Sua5/YciO/YrdC/YwlC family)
MLFVHPLPTAASCFYSIIFGVAYDGFMKIVSIEQAEELLRSGAVGILPTDTVYGLVTLATDEVAVARFYALKSREQKPGTLIAANTEQLLALGVATDEIDTVERYWPNPLSAVLTIRGLDYLTQGVGTLAMRVVADPKVAALLAQTGPLITSSANQPGEPPATSIDEAVAYFGENVDFYVDGGTIIGEPSTIIRPTGDGIEVLRQGSISL